MLCLRESLLWATWAGCPSKTGRGSGETLKRCVQSPRNFSHLPLIHSEQCFPSPHAHKVYLHGADLLQLPVRIHAYLPLKTWCVGWGTNLVFPSPPSCACDRPRLATRVAASGYSHPSGRLFWGGVKAFADGSLGSCTALMQEPYEDGACPPSGGGQQATSGVRMVEAEQLERMVAAADAAGLQAREGERERERERGRGRGSATRKRVFFFYSP